jgi:hypothetical protein
VNRLTWLKKISLTLMVIVALVTLATSTSFALDHFFELQRQGNIPFPNLTLPADGSWFFLDFRLGKYHFDTSVQLEPMIENKLFPAENDKEIEQKALSLRFSLRW